MNQEEICVYNKNNFTVQSDWLKSYAFKKKEAQSPIYHFFPTNNT